MAENNEQVADSAKHETRQKNEDVPVSITAFPNPSDNTFTIIIGNLKGNATVEIRIENLNGKNVYTANRNTTDGTYSLEWNSANMQKGIYFYRIQVNRGQAYSGKLVKL